jgi:hypothetical protein
MSRWFRVYDDMVDDPKVQRLSDVSFKALVNLWCLASQGGGKLPPIADIAFKLRMKPEKVAALISALHNAGLIDQDGDDIHPHNWNARQFKSDVSNERVKRHRKLKCNVTDAVTETPPDTESEADTEPEQRKKEPRAVALVGDWPSDAFDQFWAKYPTKIAKKAALRAFVSAKRSSVTFDRLMFGLDRYIAEKPPQIDYCHPATWLNGGRWDDQPAASAPNGQRSSGSPGRSGANDFFAGIAEVAANIDRDRAVARPADEDIPRGRFEFDAEPTRRN